MLVTFKGRAQAGHDAIDGGAEGQHLPVKPGVRAEEEAAPLMAKGVTQTRKRRPSK
jgi:hypothetical protein